MTPDLILREARIAGGDGRPVDIAVSGGRIAEISPKIDAAAAAEERLHRRLVIPGFVESHIHLDKSCLTDRCGSHGTLEGAIASVAAAKRDFTVEDVYARGRRTLEKAILQGTTHMRTHVEADPRVGLRAVEAVMRLKRDYAWAVDVQVCVFPQEGLLNDPGTDELLVEALEAGADLIGGCPYTDSDPNGQIARVFELARAYDVDIDFHLDFHLDPERMDLSEVCRQTEAHGWGGRVAVGHASALSAEPAARLRTWARRLRDAGVGVTVLPATDLFLMGRGQDRLVPRGLAPAHRLAEAGVTCSVATNNVLNPFTPFGDCSLLRMANLYATAAQAGTSEDLTRCFELVTSAPARLMNVDGYGIAVGNPADLVVLDAEAAGAALAELAPALLGFKRGRASFRREPAILMRPAAQTAPSLAVR